MSSTTPCPRAQSYYVDELPSVSLPPRGLHPSSPNCPLPPGGDLLFLSVGRVCPSQLHSLCPALPLSSSFPLWLSDPLEGEGSCAQTIRSKCLVCCHKLGILVCQQRVAHTRGGSFHDQGTVALCASCVVAISATGAEESHAKLH